MSAALLVADSGPLIALARLRLLWLPARLFGEAPVTSAVWHEVALDPGRSEWPALDAARRAGQLRVVDDPIERPPASEQTRLDPGERSAIAPALARGAAVLMDEKRGRAVAAGLGLQVLATLGPLVRARDAGMVQRVRPLADMLPRSGYHLSRPLLEHLLAAIGE